MFDGAVIEVPLNNAQQRLRLLLGLAVAAAGVVIMAVVAALSDSSARRIVLLIVALVVLLAAGVLGAGGWLATRPHQLAFAPDGFGLIAPNGLVWRVLWTEVTQVSVVEQAPRMGTRTVALVLRPASDEFGPKHPDLARFHGRFGAAAGEWGIFAGPGPELIERIDAALRQTAGAAYGGVVRAS